MPDVDEFVVFEDYLWRGLGFPVNPFLIDLLVHYEIGLCHLHPNSLLHISIFIHFCEAYLGITPHFTLFSQIFQLKRRGAGSRVVGSVYFTLHEGMDREYMKIPLSSKVKKWDQK